jgi:RNA recognition motif-containing protein
MKLFVGSLPYDLTKDELKELFSRYGSVVSATVIMDRVTGQSKGFGFVEMSQSDEGQKAMSELDGSKVKGRSIVVNLAKEDNRPPRRK